MNVCEKQYPVTEIKEHQSTKIREAKPEEVQQFQKLAQIATLALLVSPKITNALTLAGFCLSKWIPDIVINTVRNVDTVAGVISIPIHAVTQFFPENAQLFSHLVINTPIVEEILFRGVIQEILMRKVPVALLQKVNPQAANWLQSNTYAKIGRVALSTLIFALTHFGTENCAMSNRPIGVICLGALLGAIVEIKGLKQGLVSSIYAHAMNNLFGYGLHKVTGVSVDPIFDYYGQ